MDADARERHAPTASWILAQNAAIMVALTLVDGWGAHLDRRLMRRQAEQIAARVLSFEGEQHRFNVRAGGLVTRLSRTGDIIKVELDGDWNDLEGVLRMCGVMQRQVVWFGEPEQADAV